MDGKFWIAGRVETAVGAYRSFKRGALASRDVLREGERTDGREIGVDVERLGVAMELQTGGKLVGAAKTRCQADQHVGVRFHAHRQARLRRARQAVETLARIVLHHLGRAHVQHEAYQQRQRHP